MDNRLQDALRENGGFITVAQGKKAGLSHTSILRATKAGHIERVAHGVYEAADKFDDVLYASQLRRPKMIYSHGTALYLHDLSDRDPLNLSVTVPTGYNTKQLVSEGFTVFSVKKDLYSNGATKIKTKYDNEVTAYNLERTICDCVRSRSRMDAEIVTEAVKRYARSKDRDVHTLMETAAMFGVQKIMRTYMEVLL
ncbi:MAG: type IV toxin-antitoxin system AbiEi family antitoxin domain-containing protein [Oscillospiraceae bacterium]|nr:type IV toxin-antitoxin system AbiEi family antitoxin domain-containing protein [Oscillospiraceae bacterium]